MIKSSSSAAFILFVVASAATAEDARQLDAHEHGVGQLDIAFDGNQIAMELHAPGADIAGFEYAAQSAEDRAKVDAAVASLARPLDLFAMPAAAGCSVVQASASLESEEDHDDHGHKDHAEHDKHDDHEDHAEDGHKDEDHAHDEGHDHDDHDDHAESEKHEDHDDHEEHAEDAGHTEFHAEYMLECAAPDQATLIEFAYFDTFPNALELEVQVITDKGATAFEVLRDAPTLDLRDMF